MKKRLFDYRDYLLQNINPVIRFLIISDILIVGTSGMLGPIFAIFISGHIKGGNEIVAGVAAGIFLISKSVFQIPASVWIDRVRGEVDDFYFLFVASLAMTLVPLLYLVIDMPWQLYVVQFIHGVFTAFSFPPFMAIFTRHIDKRREATEWGTYFTFTDLSSAGLAAIGGVIAATLGFRTLILIVVVISFFGALLLFPIKRCMRKA